MSVDFIDGQKSAIHGKGVRIDLLAGWALFCALFAVASKSRRFSDILQTMIAYVDLPHFLILFRKGTIAEGSHLVVAQSQFLNVLYFGPVFVELFEPGDFGVVEEGAWACFCLFCLISRFH